MLKNLLVLPGGQEISSGTAGMGIKSLTLTQTVNSGTELTLGSTCAAMLEAVIYDGGELSLAQGQEVTLYKVDDAGNRTKMGIFILEKPTRAGKNSYKLLGYDRVTKLDRDLTGWLESLTGWPYRLQDFAYMVGKVCGVEIAGTFPDCALEKFTARGITGRRLMEWIGQASGQFCRANPNGILEFSWYEPVTVAIGDRTVSVAVTLQGQNLHLDGAVCVTQAPLHLQVPVADAEAGALEIVTDQLPSAGHTVEDYVIAPVENVRIATTEDDVGVCYPDTGKNTYSIVGNALLGALSKETRRSLAVTLYKRLQTVRYTPCTVKTFANTDLQAGQIVQMQGIPVYIMSKVQTGQAETLSCTGAYDRNCATVRNETTLKNLSGQVLEVKAEIDGLQVENRRAEEARAKLSLQVDGITAEVSRQSNQQEQLATQLTTLSQSAAQLSVSVQSIQQNGVEKVENAFGLTIDGSAVTIHRSGSEMTNRLDETGMFVNRGDTQMLRADARGVLATDVSVRNFLVVGDHARFEDYETDRTACFYL